MLKTVRLVMAVLSLTLLSLGYAASQLAYPQRSAEYAAWIDQPWAQGLALLLLVAAVALVFVPNIGGSDQP